MIKVLHILNSAEVGGAQSHLLSVIRLSNRVEFQHAVALPFNGPFVKDLQDISVPVHEIGMSGKFDIKTILRIKNIIKNNKIDIVHTHTSRGGLFGRLGAWLARPVIVVHSFLSLSFHEYMSFPKRTVNYLLEKFLASFTHKIIALSDNDIRTLVRQKLAPLSKFFKLYSCEDLSRFYNVPAESAAAIKKELGIKEGVLVAGTVARFVLQKSPQYLVKAARLVIDKFPESIFVLVGDGPLMPELQALAKDLGIERNLRFTGMRKDIPALMASFDVFVLCSLWEGFPLVILDAMACKKPVVASAVNGIVEEVLDGKTGFLVGPKDYNAIADALADLFRSPDKCRMMGNKGFEHLADFKVTDEVNMLENLYKSLRVEHCSKYRQETTCK